MSQPSSDAAGAAYRRKVWTKLIVFVVLVAIVWLQPKIQTWLDGRNAGGSDPAAQAEQHDSDPSITSQLPADRNPVVIRDVDEPVVAEVDRSDSTLSTKTTSQVASPSGSSLENSRGDQAKTEKPPTTQKNSGSDVVRMDRAPPQNARMVKIPRPMRHKRKPHLRWGSSTRSAKTSSNRQPDCGMFRECRQSSTQACDAARQRRHDKTNPRCV